MYLKILINLTELQYLKDLSNINFSKLFESTFGQMHTVKIDCYYFHANLSINIKVDVRQKMSNLKTSTSTSTSTTAGDF